MNKKILPPVKAYQGNASFVFVSYSHSDIDRKIVYGDIKMLHDRGYNVWYDEGIEGGDRWTLTITEHLKKASKIILFISPRSVQSDNISSEINIAKNSKKPILPIMIEPTKIEGTEIEYLIGMRNILNRTEMNKPTYIQKLRQFLDKPVKDTSPPVPVNTNSRVQSTGSDINKGLLIMIAVLLCAVSILGALYFSSNQPVNNNFAVENMTSHEPQIKNNSSDNSKQKNVKNKTNKRKSKKNNTASEEFKKRNLEISVKRSLQKAENFILEGDSKKALKAWRTATKALRLSKKSKMYSIEVKKIRAKIRKLENEDKYKRYYDNVTKFMNQKKFKQALNYIKRLPPEYLNCKNLKAEIENKIQIKKLLKIAETELLIPDLSSAEKYYKKVLIIDSTNEIALNKMKRINQLLNKNPLIKFKTVADELINANYSKKQYIADAIQGAEGCLIMNDYYQASQFYKEILEKYPNNSKARKGLKKVIKLGKSDNTTTHALVTIEVLQKKCSVYEVEANGLDEKLLGKAPLVCKVFEPGKRTFVLRAPDYNYKRLSLDLKAGEHFQETYNLNKVNAYGKVE